MATGGRVAWFILVAVMCWDASIIIPQHKAEALPQGVIFPDQLPQRPPQPLQQRPPHQQQGSPVRLQQGPQQQQGIHEGGLPISSQQGAEQQAVASRGDTCSGSGLVTNRLLAGVGTEGCDLLQGDVMWPILQGDVIWPGDLSRCVQLHSQGPCAPGFWVTLSNDIGANAGDSKCAPRQCLNGEVVMGNQCYRVNDPTMCPPTMTLQATEFGTGVCDCPSGTIYYQLTQRCYTPYTQGPCQHGGIIKVMNFDDRGESQCVKNPCPSQNMVPLDQQCLVAEQSSIPSQCHSINTTGPCNNGRISINNNLAEPGCATDSDRNIVNLPCRRGSRRDHRGQCRNIFRGRNVFGRPQKKKTCNASQLLLGGICVTRG